MMKARLTGAQKGHSLLKKKADALQMRFRLILNKIVEVSLLYSIETCSIKINYVINFIMYVYFVYL